MKKVPSVVLVDGLLEKEAYPVIKNIIREWEPETRNFHIYERQSEGLDVTIVSTLPLSDDRVENIMFTSVSSSLKGKVVEDVGGEQFILLEEYYGY